jgi:hypothetical protein
MSDVLLTLRFWPLSPLLLIRKYFQVSGCLKELAAGFNQRDLCRDGPDLYRPPSILGRCVERGMLHNELSERAASPDSDRQPMFLKALHLDNPDGVRAFL